MTVEKVTSYDPPAAPAPGAAVAPLILVAEDEAPIRELLQCVLEQAGYRVVAAADGRSALRLLAQQRPDVILTDLCMPETDGMEFLLELRRRGTGVPVIAMSGGVNSNMAGMLHTAELLGARRTLAKPFALPALVQAVQEVLGKPSAKLPPV